MNRTSLVLFLILSIAAAACGSGTPEPVTPVEPAPTPTPPQPKPPPPCEALDENCVAKDGKKAKIPATALVIEPVPGWTYAQEEKVTISQQGPEQASLVVTGHEVPDPKKMEPVYKAQLETLAGRLNVTLTKVKVKWTQPVKVPNSKIPLSRWVIEGVMRGNQKGDLMIIATDPADGKAVFGVAFVPEGDDAGVKNVVQAFKTLGPSGDIYE